MAGGKLTPRQRMINMMYLVLTALLALNISKEIINAFVTVDESLSISKANIDDKNKKTYAAVGEVKRIFHENNYGSVAEMVIKNEKFRHSQNRDLLSARNHNPNKIYENKEEVKKNHKHFVFPRELLEEETQKILEKQSEYYPQKKEFLLQTIKKWKIRSERFFSPRNY